MEANELMILDWVLIDKHPVQLTMQDLVYVYQGRECEPIRITDEILEKNGYEKAIGENPVEVWTINKGVYLHKTDNGYKLREGAEFNVLNIKYVHQLQHALRLCGLDNLADNFKIE